MEIEDLAISLCLHFPIFFTSGGTLVPKALPPFVSIFDYYLYLCPAIHPYFVSFYLYNESKHDYYTKKKKDGDGYGMS